MEGSPSSSWLNTIHYIFIIICYIICINNIFFIHSSSAHRHRGCFYILATVSNATWLWECRYLFEILISFFFLAIYPEAELLSHMVHFSCSVVSDFLWPQWTAAHQATPSITNSWSSLKLMSIESVVPSNDLMFCHPLLLPPSILCSIRVFSNE